MTQLRTKLVVGNWKLNGNKELAASLKNALEEQDFGTATVGVCPPLTLLGDLVSEGFVLGAQDVSANEKGAFTGETSGAMLKEAGVEMVIVGHSERRTYHDESNELVAQKAELAVSAGLTPIVCFGEPEEIRDAGTHIEFCLSQIAVVLDSIGEAAFAKCVLAYEPVWAIGTGKTASPEQAQEMHAKVREYLAGKNADIAATTKILYGGSVKGDNAAELFGQADVDGGLIGGASLKAEDFIEICNAAK